MKDNPDRLIFHVERDAFLMKDVNDLYPRYVRDERGWALFGPLDVRGNERHYLFSLQCPVLNNRQRRRPELHLRVRAGCRFYTLRQAWMHWGKRGCGSTRRNTNAQAVAIIRLMLLQAQAYGLLPIYAAPIKFDSTILKPKR